MGDIECVGEMRNTYIILVGEPERKIYSDIQKWSLRM
jgi:hypothetical protein